MEKPYLLHLFTPAPLASPFDINMAYDAGYNAVIPYSNVGLNDISSLTQDTIFSRGTKGVRRTGIFIGGRDIELAAEMLTACQKAMVPPFEVSVFADPSGAFTTAAALVAIVEKHLKHSHDTNLLGKEIVIFGGTGPVGSAAAAIASNQGGIVKLVSYAGIEKAQKAHDILLNRYNANVIPVEAHSDLQIRELVTHAEIILCCAKAGVQVISKDILSQAQKLLVAADVNAVPPAGIEGIGVMDNGVSLSTSSNHAVGIGALTIGDIKYKVMRQLFKDMLAAEKPLYLDFYNAFDSARQFTA